MTPITYISDQMGDYAKALDKATTLKALRLVCWEWRTLAKDACKVVEAMSNDDFAEFRVGLEKERSGDFAGVKFADKYAWVLMPELLFKISILAFEYKVPWGLMYLRLKETGQLARALGSWQER